MGNGAGFKRVDRKGLAELTKKVNRVVPEIQTTNNTDTNQVGLKKINQGAETREWIPFRTLLTHALLMLVFVASLILVRV